MEVVKALRSIKKEFDDLGKPIKSIVTDLGLEYNNQYFNHLFYGIKDKIFRKNDEIFNSALAIVDRVMRTLRLIFKRFFVSKNSFHWIDYLGDIERNYNNTFHSTIKQLPDDVFYGKATRFLNILNQ